MTYFYAYRWRWHLNISCLVADDGFGNMVPVRGRVAEQAGIMGLYPISDAAFDWGF